MPMLMFPPLVVADIKLVVNSGIDDPRARMYPDVASESLYLVVILFKLAYVKFVFIIVDLTYHKMFC